MVDRMPWIERRFTFDVPNSMFPNVLERLRGTPARVSNRLLGVDAGLLVRRVGDTWSIQENVGHLIDVEQLWDGRLDDFEHGLDTLRPADMSNRQTHEAEYNDRPFAAILVEFRRVRDDLVARLEALDDEVIERVAHHPRLDQPMRLLDLLIFAAEHDDHHLARISELLRIVDQ
jgi:uncharacterized damage-inducible protein DinB